MAKDITDVMRDTVGHVVRDAAKNVGVGEIVRDATKNVDVGDIVRDVTKSIGGDGRGRSSDSPLAGIGGLAAGAGLAVLAPVAAKRAGEAVKRLAGGGAKEAAGGAKSAVEKPRRAVSEATSKLSETVGKGVGEKVRAKVGERGGEEQAPGAGMARWTPVEQSMDVAVPIETCYNQWTQFEDWPLFMERVTGVTQEDPCTVSFTTKIWGRAREFTARIETQRPDERVKWRVERGVMHTGVATFHELAPRLTRVELTLEVDPGSLLEKVARGPRQIKRAMHTDLQRFKAFIEVQEIETGAWRGVIEDGELVEDHDPGYDEERDYSDVAQPRAGEGGEEQPQEEEEAQAPSAASEEEQPAAPAPEDEEPQQQPARAEPGERRARTPSTAGRSRGAGAGTSGRAAGRRESSRRKAPAGRS